MDRLFCVLEETMNKSAIANFRNFIQKYPDVTKWFICSDYCLDDKGKVNNVISFTIYPYILDFNQWNNVIEFMQKSDLKHCRNVSPQFCDFTKAGYFFSFNFILDKNCILDKWRDKYTLDKMLDDFIEMTEKWQETTPQNAMSYIEMNKRLKALKNQTKKKSFNYKLMGRVVGISFLVSYLKYLLYRELDSIEIFSWLSDRDAITNWNNEIYLDLYHIISHCLIDNKLGSENFNMVKEVAIENVNENMFYDSLNRVADFICGGIADFNYSEGSVTGKKQLTLMEDVISDNEYLIILKIAEKSVSRVVHQKNN